MFVQIRIWIPRRALESGERYLPSGAITIHRSRQRRIVDLAVIARRFHGLLYERRTKDF
jgi:hypothetical protein